MLTFLNNIFLPALAAALLPILIHLFTRRRLKRVNWPSLRFLLEIQKKQMKRLRLKQIILLILRILIILLVVGAFARPAIRGVFGGGKGAHENTAVAILLDRSYSMGQEAAGVDMFTRAKHIAGDILDLLNEGDELLIVPFDRAPALSAATEPTRILANAHENIDSVKLSDSGTDIWTGVSFALEKLEKSRLLHREVYILTDNRAFGWRRGGELAIPERTRLYSVSLSPDDERNLGVTEIEFPRSLLERNVPFSISANVKSFAPGAVSDHVVDLFVDSERVAQRSIDLLPGGAAQVKLSAEVDNVGFHYGRVALEGDALPADNSRYFSFHIPDRQGVLVVGGAESVFIATALAPSGEDFFTIKRIGYHQLGGQKLSSFDVIILSDPKALSTAIGNAVRGFVHRGGGLIVFLGGSPDPKEAIASIIGDDAKIKVLASIGDEESAGRFELQDADFDHPIFMPYSEEGLPGVSFRRIAAIESAPSSPLLFSNGLPAIAEGEIGDGKIAVCGFSTDLRYGDLATSGFIVPLIHRLAQYLAEDVAAFDPGYIVGDEAIRTIEGVTGNIGAIRLTTPREKSRFVQPRFGGGKTVIGTGILDEAGIYRMFSDSQLVDLFAVNVDNAESDPTAIETGDIEKIAPIVWLNPESNIEEEILSARYGRELHHAMLILAFILMFAELSLGSRWRKPRDLSGTIRDHGAL